MNKRPYYETEEHKRNEQEMRVHTCQAWGVGAVKLTWKVEIDDFLIDGDKVVALAEYKDRNFDYDLFYKQWHSKKEMFKRLFVSAKKIRTGQEMAKQAGVPFFMVFRLNGRMFYVDVTTIKLEMGIDGRYDRNDSGDEEPVVFFEKDMLTEF